MMLSPHQRAELFDAQGVIITDQACRRCGYNLRGLREEGRCPECATPVGLSTTGDLLRFADPIWVERVARGLTIILWMILVSILIAIAGALIGAVFEPVVGQLLTFGAGLISLYGAWLMTEPDPSGIGEDPNLTARKIIRISLVVGLVSQAAQFLVQSIALPSAVTPIILILGIAAAIVGLVGEYAKFLYYERLSRRIPDEALAKRSRFLRWGYVIALGVVVVFGGVLAAIAILAPQAGTSMFAPFACMMAPAGIAFIVFAVMTLFLLLRLRKAIAEQARAGPIDMGRIPGSDSGSAADRAPNRLNTIRC